MSHLLRPLLIALAASLATAGMAQNPFWLHAHYQVNDCAGPQLGNLALEIYFGGTGNPSSQSLDWLVTTPNCSSSQLVGGYGPNTLIRLSATTMCNGTVLTLTDTVQFTSTPDTIDVYFNFECVGGNVTDCNGVVGGSAMPGTPCDDGDPLTVNDTWSEVCVCSGSPTSACAACFTVAQASNGGMLTPFTAEFTNCTAGSAPFNYLWTLPDGTTSSQANETYVFNAPGVYDVCLTIADASGCTSTLCDSVAVAADGTISTGNIWYDCLGMLWGDSLPGTTCYTPATGFGIWSANCICIPDSINTDCEAGFWAIQAYEVDSLNPSVGQPIPNTVWIWNLSTGGADNYQFLWSFGDGTSSTDPYPTHYYASGGPYLLCLTLWDSNGCTDTYCDSISVDEDGIYNGLIQQENHARSGFTINVLNQLPTGLADVTAFDGAALWPNPVNDAMSLSFRSTVSGTVPMSIIDLNGRVMEQQNITFVRGTNRIDLAATQLAPGMYVLRIGNGNNDLNIRFVKN